MNQTPFHTLDYNTQIARFDALATAALHAYDLADADCTLMSYTNNTIYCVVAGTWRGVLRLHRPGLKARTWIESERVWLAALHAHSSLYVPEPLRTIYSGRLAGVEDPVHCDLLGWVDGESIALDALTPAQIEAIGAFAARLHGMDWEPPAGFVRPHLDWEGLFGERSPYNPQAGAHLFTEAQRQVIDAVTARVRETMDMLDDYGLIHADLLPKNLLFGGGDDLPGAVDFDDCAFGYRLYDLAGMLWVSRQREDFPVMRAALWGGYTRVRPLDDSQQVHLEAFLAARHVASCRWIAGNTANPVIRERAPQIIAERVEELRGYLSHGRLAMEA